MIVVFSGPPCSGKSALSSALASSLAIPVLSMDTCRLALFPNGTHSKAERQIAYRAMHCMADQHLEAGRSVILDATYQPDIQRAAVEGIANLRRVPLLIVQCHADPKLAVSRFLARPAGHAGADLTCDRVRDLADGFRYSEHGLQVDTSQPVDLCLGNIKQYVLSGEGITLGSWPALGFPDLMTEASIPDETAEIKLTNRSRRRARIKKATAGTMVWTAIACALIALAPIAVSLFDRAVPLDDRFRTGTRWFTVLSLRDASAWAASWLVVAGLAAIFTPLIEWLTPVFEQANTILSAGRLARYDPVKDSRPGDEQLHAVYRLRSSCKDGFLIDAVPIWFVIPPRAKFEAVCQATNEAVSDELLSNRAADSGLDWGGFREWFIAKKRAEFDSWTRESGIRIVSRPLQGPARSVTLFVGECTWADYVTRELAINLSGKSLPHMRQLLEGSKFTTGELDLDDISDAASRYSMLMSTTTLVCTNDGFLVLHRRSKHVSQGIGGLSATATGFTKWADMSSPGTAMRDAALRELKEETAISSTKIRDVNAPFVGAAFNLLHGRDLNFYAYFDTSLTRAEVSSLRPRASDRWEIANLVFVPIVQVSDNGLLLGDLGRLMPEASRHLRGALFALARSGELRRTKERLELR